MVGAERGRTGGQDPVEVAAGLMSVAKLVRYGRQLEDERQQQGIGVRPETLGRREGLLQHPTGGARVAALPVQPRQEVCGAEHLGMIRAVRWRMGRLHHVGEELTRAGQVTGVTQSESPMLHRGQGRGRGIRHVAMLPARRARRYCHSPPVRYCHPPPVRYCPRREPMCMIHPGGVQ